MLFPRGLRHFYIPRSSLSRHGNPFTTTAPAIKWRLQSLERGIRLNSTSAKPKYVPKKALYPERLLVYHAGTGRIVFIGCLKVTTIFVFAFFTFAAFPYLLNDPNQPVWVPPAVLVCGILPLLIVRRTTAPFITYVHLRLPAYARQSRSLLERYAKNLSRDAELDITTMTGLGRSRVQRMPVSTLAPVSNPRFLGIENFSRDTTSLNLKRRWWSGRAIPRFSTKGGSGKCKESWVWNLVVENIHKNAQRAAQTS